MSYADAADPGACEGWQASPSNPTGGGTPHAKAPLTEIFVFRCSAAEKAELRAKAEAAGTPNEIAAVIWGSPYFREKHGDDLGKLEEEIFRILDTVEVPK